MASLETKLQKEIDKLIKDPIKAKVRLPKRLSIIETQVPLYSAVYLLTRNSDFNLPEPIRGTGIIGKIDVIFRYRQTNYVCEIKDTDPKNASFWYATKAIAYCEYYKWQFDTSDFKPAVMIPLETLKLEHQLIASKLGINIFVFSLNRDGWFTVREVGDTPYWKQEL